MIINNFKIIREDNVVTTDIKFSDRGNLVFSPKNSKGKTTIVKLMLKTLGFNSNLTVGIEKKKFITELVLSINGDNIFLSYDNYSGLISLTINEIHIGVYDSNSMDDRINLVTNIFLRDYEVENDLLARNLLGCFYIDQDRGWTLINKGDSIGFPKNGEKFNIISIIESISGLNNNQLDSQIEILESNISKYRNILHVLDDANDTLESSEMFETSNLQIEVREYKVKLRQVTNEINALTKIIRNNQSAIDYILNYGLSIKLPENLNPIFIDRNSLKEGLFEFNNYEILQEVSKSRINDLSLIKNQYESKIEDSLKRINDLKLFDMENIADSVAKNLQNLTVNISNTEAFIENEKNEKNRLVKIRNEVSESSQDFIDNTNRYKDCFLAILSFLNIPTIEMDKFKKNIYSKKVKGLSGSSRAKISLATRLALIKIIEEKTRLKLPIIVDSPFSEEFDDVSRNKVIESIWNFTKGQVILFSIEKDLIISIADKNTNIHKISNGVLETLDEVIEDSKSLESVQLTLFEE